MSPRKYRRRKKNVSRIFIFSFVIIFLTIIIVLWIWWVSFLEKNIFIKHNFFTWTTNIIADNKKTEKIKNIYTNSKINWRWIIKEIPYDMKVSTSYQVVYSWKTFFAKSDNYLLWNYVWWKINFSGVVVGFSPDNMPVLNIIHIASNDNSKKEEIKEEKQKNKFINYNNLIINLESMSDDLKVKNESWYIFIYKSITWFNNNLSWNLDLSWEKSNIKEINYIKISSFKCDSSNYMTDCDKLKQNFNNLHLRTIVNNNWLTFYKLPETNQYEAFQDEYWYYFYPLTGNFYSLINVFSVVNTKELKTQTIKNTCRNSNIQMITILDTKISNDEYSVIWLDQNSNKIKCKLSLSYNNWLRTANLKSIWYVKNNLTENYTWLNENDYLIYKSRAYWFKIYMPKWIQYNSNLTNEDFGISGLKCLQIVNIAHRKKWNLSNPNLKLYYCKSEISKYLIENWLSTNYKNFKVITWKNKVFIVIYQDNDIANKILNYLKVY